MAHPITHKDLTDWAEEGLMEFQTNCSNDVMRIVRLVEAHHNVAPHKVSAAEALAGTPIMTRNRRPVTQLRRYSLAHADILVGVCGGRIYEWDSSGMPTGDDRDDTELELVAAFAESPAPTHWANLYCSTRDPNEIYGYAYQSQEIADHSAGVAAFARIACVPVHIPEEA